MQSSFFTNPQITPIIQSQPPPPLVPMAFFENTQDSPISLQPLLHNLSKNPIKFAPRYIYEESKMVEEHIKVFKELCNRKQVQHENVVIRLFPYTFGEIEFQWYVHLSPACITNWASFEGLFFEQFKTYVNPTLLHHQFMTMRKDLGKTISRYNHRFHMAYRGMESPFTVTLLVAI